MQVQFGERLYTYARQGDVRSLQTLPRELVLQHVNWRNPKNYKQTPLWTAAKYGRVAAAIFLLEHGAQAELADNFGFNSLHQAASCNRTLVVAAILDRNKTLVNARTKEGGFTALYLACMEGYAAVARVLCQRGADVNATDDNMCSPLMAAVCGNHVACCEVLVDQDVSLEASNSAGDAALHLAARLGKMSTLRWLLLQGASGARENKEGKIALDVAQDNKQYQAAELLRNPPRLSGLPRWRPSLHRSFPVAFRQQARDLVLVMTRLRRRKEPCGPLWMVPNDIVIMMVRELGDLYRLEK